jgi:copper chaperone NosL
MRSLKTLLTAAIGVVLLLLAGTNVFAQEDIDAHRSCTNCGMDRKAFGYSRMLIKFEDGIEVGVCSLHCAVIELEANKERKVKMLLVADRDTRELIDAEQAFWVVGGSKRGVMTEHPTWAFGKKGEAEAFIKEYGGTLASWQEVLATAREEAVRQGR